MCTGNLPGGKGRPARKADNLTAIFEPTVLENMEASTSHNPMGLKGFLGIALYLLFLLLLLSLFLLFPHGA
jgi:hypothetical protein